MHMPASTTHILELNGQHIEYSVRHSAKARHKRIRVGPSGVEVVLPLRTDARHAEALLREHGDWLLRHTRRMQDALKRQQALHQYKNVLLLRGREVRVQVRVITDATAHVTLDGDEITISVPTGSAGDSQQVLQAWLRKQAHHDLSARVRERGAQMGLVPTRLVLRDQRTRWGSCSRTGTISLNWRLVLGPPTVLDYVVVHELAHLREMNHSPRFWHLVRSFCPDFERHKRLLKENGWRLTMPTNM